MRLKRFGPGQYRAVIGDVTYTIRDTGETGSRRWVICVESLTAGLGESAAGTLREAKGIVATWVGSQSQPYSKAIE